MPGAGMGAPEPPGPDVDGSDGAVMINAVVEPCACALADRDALLRVTLLELDDCQVRARVDEVLSVAPQVTLDVDEDSELTSRAQGRLVAGRDLPWAPATRRCSCTRPRMRSQASSKPWR